MVYSQTKRCYRAENLQENIFFGGLVVNKCESSEKLLELDDVARKHRIKDINLVYMGVIGINNT